MAVNRDLREAREASDMTQAQVAEIVGISANQYHNIECNKSVPSVRTAIKIADVFGVDDVRALFEGAVNRTSKSGIE